MKPLLFLVATLLFAFLVPACGENPAAEAPYETGATVGQAGDPGPIHVHGLGVNPSDDALFIATHTGLFRLPGSESEPIRVGENYQDTMGFTVVGPDAFLGSGHPGSQDLPPFLGLIESSDAGETWEPRSLLGDADFHVLEASGTMVYGFGSDWKTRKEQFLVSQDSGKSWSELEPPESLLSLAIGPDDSDDLIASGRHSLYRSEDAGQTWQRVDGEPGLISWPEPDALFLIDKDGSVVTSTGPETDWQEVGHIGGAPAAFEAATADELYAALHDGSIGESTNGGATWTVRSKP